eukprot:TRINITY_DN8399_c0_g1_i1.p1 TRINITY_DN8399_c0_g1~~TRINITY_DN8399_c0_g1_i1.p1  ORF type:complete len:497 (+),score=64.14 TRINITY_DN8399_c0_g1_i1:116-1606(+)
MLADEPGLSHLPDCCLYCGSHGVPLHPCGHTICSSCSQGTTPDVVRVVSPHAELPLLQKSLAGPISDQKHDDRVCVFCHALVRSLSLPASTLDLLRCVHCGGVCHHACDGACGHSMCEACAKYLCHTTQVCPVCHQTLQIDDLSPLRNLRRRISEMVFVCKFGRTHGCSETGNLECLVKHESQCQYGERVCEGCGWHVKRKEWFNHLKLCPPALHYLEQRNQETQAKLQEQEVLIQQLQDQLLEQRNQETQAKLQEQQVLIQQLKDQLLEQRNQETQSKLQQQQEALIQQLQDQLHQQEYNEQLRARLEQDRLDEQQQYMHQLQEQLHYQHDNNQELQRLLAQEQQEKQELSQQLQVQQEINQELRELLELEQQEKAAQQRMVEILRQDRMQLNNQQLEFEAKDEEKQETSDARPAVRYLPVFAPPTTCYGLALSSTGCLYLTDFNHHLLDIIDLATNTRLATWGSYDQPGHADIHAFPQFYRPSGVVLDELLDRI